MSIIVNQTTYCYIQWANKGSKFYNTLMKSWLQDHDKEMYSTHNEEKSVIAAEISIRTFKNKIYQYMIMFILIN